jgi:DNA-binding NarL/FixJ family response regulator
MVLLAEDDAGLRSLIAEELRASSHEVIEAATGPEAVACAARARPDLALLDVVLPGSSGYEVCRWLREHFGEDLPIVLMSGKRAESYDRAAGLALGADAYLAKPFDLEELSALIRTHSRRIAQSAPSPQLTARQLEVLHLLATGLNRGEIAERLVLSPKTIGAHVEHIFERLGVHSRAQAVAHAYRDHLFQTP